MARHQRDYLRKRPANLSLVLLMHIPSLLLDFLPRSLHGRLALYVQQTISGSCPRKLALHLPRQKGATENAR